jgi:hypothetical protein
MVEVVALVESGLLALAFFPEWSPTEFEPISGMTAPQLIQDVQSWRPPSETPSGAYYAVATTDAGDLAYQAFTPQDFRRFAAEDSA